MEENLQSGTMSICLTKSLAKVSKKYESVNRTP